MNYFRTEKEVEHCFYTELGENESFSFLHEINLNLKEKISVSYWKNKIEYSSEEIDYTELEDYLINKNIFQILIREKDYYIVVSGPEIHIYSNSKEKAKHIFKLLSIK